MDEKKYIWKEKLNLLYSIKKKKFYKLITYTHHGCIECPFHSSKNNGEQDCCPTPEKIITKTKLIPNCANSQDTFHSGWQEVLPLFTMIYTLENKL